jgi:hypothetical protein
MRLPRYYRASESWCQGNYEVFVYDILTAPLAPLPSPAVKKKVSSKLTPFGMTKLTCDTAAIDKCF